MHNTSSLDKNTSNISKFLTPMKGMFGKLKVECSPLLTMPKVLNNYVASFLDAKRECLSWALLLKRSNGETGLKCRQINILCSDQNIEEAPLSFLEPAIRINSSYGWQITINWLKKHPQCYKKIEEIIDNVHSHDSNDNYFLNEILSLCKNLKRLKTGDIEWNQLSENLISNELECLELSASFSSDLNLYLIEKMFPKLKFLKACVPISFYCEQEDVIESIITFQKLKQKYSGISICLGFNPDQFDTLIQWCQENTNLLENITILNGARCSLDDDNKDKWKTLIEKIPNLDYLVISNISTPFVLTTKDSKIRKIEIMYDLSHDLTLENLPELEILNYQTIASNITITLRGVPKLNYVHGEKVKRPLSSIQFKNDENKICECKVIDEDFLTK